MSWCPYIHDEKCNRGCRGFERRWRDESRISAMQAVEQIHAKRMTEGEWSREQERRAVEQQAERDAREGRVV